MEGGTRDGDVSVPEPRHLLIAVCFAIGFALLRFLLDAFVYKRLAMRLLWDKAASIKTDATKRVKVAKFSESMWKLTYYVSAQLWVIAIIDQNHWTADIRQYFNGWPNRELTLWVELFYMCQCGFYIYSIAALLAWETRRKDFSVMMCHHVVTTALIGYSYFARFFEIGTIVLALHDTSDVFLEAAKLLKYTGKEMGASVCFALFSLSWLCLRLVYFPFWIIRATSLHTIEDVPTVEHFTPMYYSFNAMLITLLIFHVYWWVLICAMIGKQMRNRGKVGEDIRSADSEGEE